MKVKIVSGYSHTGGSTHAIITLCNYFNSKGIDTTFYGPHEWHLDKCKSGGLGDVRINENDVFIFHYFQLPKRPDVRKVILWCHEKWWFKVGQIKQYWDSVVFLHNDHRLYHEDYKGNFDIIPNFKSGLKLTDKTGLEKVAGIIGTIEDRKQTHVSIQRALDMDFEKIYLFGNVGDQNYFEKSVKPLISDRVILHGYESDKQKIYNSVGSVFHSSKGEVASLVKDECHETGTNFYGNSETENQISILSNEEIFDLWIKTLNK